jgi:hypothetical protein
MVGEVPPVGAHVRSQIPVRWHIHDWNNPKHHHEEET